MMIDCFDQLIDRQRRFGLRWRGSCARGKEGQRVKRDIIVAFRERNDALVDSRDVDSRGRTDTARDIIEGNVRLELSAPVCFRKCEDFLSEPLCLIEGTFA